MTIFWVIYLFSVVFLLWCFYENTKLSTLKPTSEDILCHGFVMLFPVVNAAVAALVLGMTARNKWLDWKIGMS